MERKFEFWKCLDSIIDDNKNSKFMLLGDLNSRLSTDLDSDQCYIGPYVRGKRQSIPDPDRDNAEYLLSFLQSKDLFLSQTYIDLPPSQRVSYKEMTCQDPLLQKPNVEDWTTLDYVLAPLGMKPELSIKGSVFQQAVNTKPSTQTPPVGGAVMHLHPQENFSTIRIWAGFLQHR